MALALYNRVQETTNTTGTGTITLAGAVSGFQSFAVIGNGNTTYYCITSGAAWEVGLGTYTSSGTTLARTLIYSNSLGTTAPISLTGTSNVFVTLPAEQYPGTSYARTAFTATASQTTFTVNYTVGYVQVYVNGVLLNASDYTASTGTSIVLSVACNSGDIVEIIAFNATNLTGTSRTVTDFTATASQTTFTVTYTPNFLDVYRNGSKLATADYTATNGTTVVLVNACTAGDIVQTIAYSPVLIGDVASFSAGTTGLTPSSAATGNITLGGTLAVANGGTGVTTSTGSGAVVLGTSPTLTSAIFVTPASSVITRATSQASTSGTAISFTGIPSWVKRITVMFNAVSTSGTSFVQVQIGSTTYTTTGYVSSTSTNGANGSSTTGFIATVNSGAADVRTGLMTITNLSGNIWVMGANIGSTYPNCSTSMGVVTLSGVLDRVQVTTVNGTDTFDAGSINILYE